MSGKTITGLVISFVLGGSVVAFLLLSRQAKIPVLITRTDPPRISFEEHAHNLGTIEQSTAAVYTFKLHNLGGEPLLIQDISTSSPFIIANIRDKMIEPGKITNLDLTLRPPDTVTGPLQKVIRIRTNDPKHAMTELTLSAMIVPEENDVVSTKSANTLR